MCQEQSCLIHIYTHGSAVHNSPFFLRAILILTKFRSKVVLSLKLLMRYSKFYFYPPYFGKAVEGPKPALLLRSSLHIPREKIQSSVKQERKCNRPISIRSTKLHLNKLIWFYIILYKKENHQSLNSISRNSVYSWFLIYFLCIYMHIHTLEKDCSSSCECMPFLHIFRGIYRPAESSMLAN